jgi:tRNA dimethylallyltransferase
MFLAGLIEEARGILGSGRGEALRALRAIGYDEAIAVIESRIAPDEAEKRTRARTAQLAKRQRTWFRHQVEAARVDAADSDAAVLAGRIVERLGAGP